LVEASRFSARSADSPAWLTPFSTATVKRLSGGLPHWYTLQPTGSPRYESPLAATKPCRVKPSTAPAPTSSKLGLGSGTERSGAAHGRLGNASRATGSSVCVLTLCSSGEVVRRARRMDPRCLVRACSRNEGADAGQSHEMGDAWRCVLKGHRESSPVASGLVKVFESPGKDAASGVHKGGSIPAPLPGQSAFPAILSQAPSALGLRPRTVAKVLKGRLSVCAQLVQSSFQNFRALCPARNPRAEAMESAGFRGLTLIWSFQDPQLSVAISCDCPGG